MSLCCCLADVYKINFIREMPGGGDIPPDVYKIHFIHEMPEGGVFPPYITSIAHQKHSEGVLFSKKHSWWLIMLA